jgi:hypothetical protein
MGEHPQIPPITQKNLRNRWMILYLLRPHRALLALAFLAVLGEAVTDLLEPWPLKIVFDYVFGTKHLPAWMSRLPGPTFGLTKVGILHFAILAVIVIAVAGLKVTAKLINHLTSCFGVGSSDWFQPPPRALISSTLVVICCI